VETAILLDANDLVDRPADKVEPGDGSREGETRDDGVEGLGLELLGENLDSFDGGGGHFIVCLENYSGNNSTSDRILLNLCFEYPLVAWEF